MSYEIFLESLIQDSPQNDYHPLLNALWYDFKGDWESAHNIAQLKEGTLDYDRLHAYLHRKEGDNWNANYWYRRCGEPMKKISLEEEWLELVKAFTAKY